ncbi:MAG: TlpA family protein disulfide reductase [Alphaproteobacteria bacterium]|nr:TlpA family protein disulfide reductase [Alphaproteobacteria bacterium]
MFLSLIFILSVAAGPLAVALSPPAFRSAIGQFTLLRPIDPAPGTVIYALDGTTTRLSRFRGKVIVVNFWATWCRPCKSEMPALDRLAAESNPNQLAVIAVSIDRDSATAATPFITAHHLTHLAVYLDPNQGLGSLNADHVAAGALPLWGLPITYVIDKEGGVIGYVTGAAKWDSPKATKFLGYFLKQTAP